MATKIRLCRRCQKSFKRGEGASTLDWCMTGDLQDCCSDGCARVEAFHGMMPIRERRQYKNQYVDGQPVPMIM